MSNIAIIGAGISGLCLANQLKTNFNVTIFEKSKSPGGRLATRYKGCYEFDHGAQFFSAKDKDFIKFTKDLLRERVLKIWNARFVEIDGNKIIKSRNWQNSYPHYVGVPRMSSIAKYLANGLDINLNTKITKVNRKENKWTIFCNENNSYENFDWLVFAIPAAQAKEIIFSYSNYLNKLNDIKMLACCSLMLGFKEPLDLNFDAALVKNSNISWISINSSKPERKNNFSMVALSTNKWAENNIEKEDSFIIENLIKEISFILNRSFDKIDHIDLQKWKYANAPKINIPPLVYEDINLAFCGDWASKGIIEGAFLSAKTVFDKLKNINIK